jgi:hypothetical protein
MLQTVIFAFMHRSELFPAGVFRPSLVLFLGLWAGTALGQSGTPIRLSPEDQGRGRNGVQKNFYFTTKEQPTDDDYQNAGYFGQRLRPYLAGNQEALGNLNRYRRQKWIFLAERLTFVGGVAVYGAQTFSGSGDQHYFDNAQKVTLGVVAGSLLANIFITRHTNEHFVRAVEANNAGLSASGHTGLWQRLAPAGVGVAASATGQPLLALRWQLR